MAFLILIFMLGFSPDRLPAGESDHAFNQVMEGYVSEVERDRSFTEELNRQCLYAEDDGEGREKLCSCFAKQTAPGKKSAFATACAPGGLMDRWSAEMFRLMNPARPAFYRDEACWKKVLKSNLDLALFSVAYVCEKKPEAVLRAFQLPRSKGERCWRFNALDDKGCITAEPCGPIKGSLLSALPLAAGESNRIFGERDRLIPAGQQVRFCNQSLKATNEMKDWHLVNTFYHLPIPNYAAMGWAYKKGEKGPAYSAANCHGTACHLAGSFLDDTKVTGLFYYGPATRMQCQAAAETAFDKARSKLYSMVEPPPADDFLFPMKETIRAVRTQVRRVTPVAVKDLGIKVNGLVINMDYDDSCSENSCGRADLAIVGCENQKLDAHIFVRGMCVKCWSKKLGRAGFMSLGDSATWQSLRPGCILNLEDHSITLVGEGGGLCYYYQASSPHGPTSLFAAPCGELWARYPRRWCPAHPMEFQLAP